MIGGGEGLADVLLDDDEGCARRQDRRQCGVELLDDHGCEAERHLVEEQEPRVAHQSAPDGERLLLTAGESGGRARHQPLQQWERGQHQLLVPRSRAGAIGADAQVLGD